MKTNNSNAKTIDTLEKNQIERITIVLKSADKSFDNLKNSISSIIGQNVDSIDVGLISTEIFNRGGINSKCIANVNKIIRKEVEDEVQMKNKEKRYKRNKEAETAAFKVFEIIETGDVAKICSKIAYEKASNKTKNRLQAIKNAFIESEIFLKDLKPYKIKEFLQHGFFPRIGLSNYKIVLKEFEEKKTTIIKSKIKKAKSKPLTKEEKMTVFEELIQTEIFKFHKSIEIHEFEAILEKIKTDLKEGNIELHIEDVEDTEDINSEIEDIKNIKPEKEIKLKTQTELLQEKSYRCPHGGNCILSKDLMDICPAAYWWDKNKDKDQASLKMTEKFSSTINGEKMGPWCPISFDMYSGDDSKYPKNNFYEPSIAYIKKEWWDEEIATTENIKRTTLEEFNKKSEQ